MSLYPRYNSNISKSGENGYSWYECNCCPYGYHIDLDFVRYCESISKEADNRTGSIKRRKDRRRQRQSMEVLLGLTPPVLAALEESFKPVQEHESQKIEINTTRNFPFSTTDSFDDAVSDFERTLQRSKYKLSNNLPDVTAVSENLRRAPSISSLSSTSGSMTVLPSTQDRPLRPDFDAVSVESCGLSPMALQSIRESLALSLERTRDLEDQVRLIPDLKEQLQTLKNENRRLLLKIQTEPDSVRLNHLDANYFHPPLYNRTRSQSFTHIDSLDNATKKKPPPPPPRKDFGVMCGVLTRNIGVGHQNPNTKTVSTTTYTENDAEPELGDKWLSEKVKFMNNQNLLSSYQPKILVAKGTQTLFAREKRDVSIQSVLDKPAVKKITVSGYTQTIEIQKSVRNIGTIATPSVANFTVQKNVECYSIGSSDDTIDDIICEKCNAFKRSVGVGPDKPEDIYTSPISLASLSSRSKSFNLGEDRLNLQTRARTVATQYEINNVVNKSSQCEVKTHSRFSQHDVKVSEKNTQCEQGNAISKISKNTDTKDLKSVTTKHVACEAKQSKASTSDTGVNTLPIAEKVVEKVVEKIIEKPCGKCINREKEDNTEKDRPCNKCAIRDREDSNKEAKKDGGSPTPSRIPRPQIPTTPVEVRKFRRQDTYTKIYEKSSPTSPVSKLSGLDLSPKAISAESISPFDKIKQNFNLDAPTTSTTLSAQNGVNSAPITKVQIQKTTLPVSESAIFQPISQTERKKSVPSREMQGAMKVLNDAFQKNPSKVGKNHTAINIVQEEWFKISSLVTANPLDVEDYLDAFEDMSSLLLEYVVNMSDGSGNTAMHYAVSHGNFDVVSILLDSKVCDINKPNKAGYTSVMLVSLAEVRSQTHANVVRRLFQLADVNIRAKQHGQTALMLAVSHGRLDMVKMLLQAGADINIQDEDGSTALMCAAEHGHIEIVKHFLSHPDCDSSITDVDGSTALKIAMEAGHRHIGVLLYAHERNHQKSHSKIKKTKSVSPKTPSSPLPIRSSHRALTDTKK